MCLGIPGQVVEMVDGYGGQLALVDVQGAQRRVNLGMLTEAEQDVSAGDWVLLHMGFAVQRIDASGAEKALDGLKLMGSGSDFDDARA
jgi:hydrogenase expression/formation protein HypC